MEIFYKKMVNITIREMEIKTTLRYHLTLVRMSIIKNLQIINAGEGVGNSILGGNINWYSLYGEQYRGFLKKLKMELPYDLAIPPQGIYPEKTII